MSNIIRQPCDEGVLLTGKAGSPCSPHVGAWVLAATILGSSMGFIDGSVVNVALPAIQGELGATAVDALWIVESYALFLAALLLLGGSLGDHFGRRRIFAAGIGLFALASIWCGFAPDPGQLIIARAVQGIGGALLIPGSLAIISDAFDEERRGKAIGTWAAFSGITSVLGPVLGGYLVDTLSWRWVFFINIPLAAVVLVITLTRVPESRDEAARRLDPWGAVLATVGLGGLVFGLIEGSTAGFTAPLVLGSLLVGCTSLAGFVVVQQRVREPMMPLSLFRSRNFTGANLFTLLLYFALGGALFFLPFNLIQVQGYTATAAGAAFVPAIVLMFFLSRYTGALSDRIGAKIPLVAGSALAAAGFALLAVPGVDAGPYWTSYFPAIVVLGLGLSILVPNLTTVALNAVPGHRAGLASGINNAFSRVASLLAIAVLGGLMFAAFSPALDARTEGLDLSTTQRAQLEVAKVDLGAAQPPPGLPEETAAAIEQAVDEAYVTGFRVSVLVCAGLALASSLSAALLIQKERRERGHGVEEARV
ncbi:EmrB/QacA subfamily drug resistance transporter [Arthrobacter pigmenti]|uniref:EmrB/QacA subfamily drug resistance transporter n=1 Tax=Arthrobacter pigmenti TaxID=271432 RepID=A0A846RPI8_9MICC|nr:MFS transporter [Arthrobacter pigmenti]NJC23490.1 EmrB/QacA subfamily drug resistance transporter [Arthrobacter pigmenti]